MQNRGWMVAHLDDHEFREVDDRERTMNRNYSAYSEAKTERGLGFRVHTVLLLLYATYAHRFQTVVCDD